MTELTVKQLEETLKRSKQDYRVDGQNSDQSSEIIFIGPFEGRPVIWQAHIQTLKSYADQVRLSVDENQSMQLQQFIEINQQDDNFLLHVGINLDKIDEAAIKRTIIMIRKYKRLHLGRHEYGDFVEF